MKIIESDDIKKMELLPEIEANEVLEYCCLGFPNYWYEVPKDINMKYFEPLRMRIRKKNEKIIISGKIGKTVNCSKCLKLVTLTRDIYDISNIICDDCAYE